MKRALLIFVMACGSPKDPHVVVQCVGYLTQTGSAFSGTCEVACQHAGSNGNAPSGTGGTCMATHGTGDFPQTTSCNATLMYDGQSGCCVPGTDGVADIEFYDCK